MDYLPFTTTGPNNPIAGDVSQNGTVQAYDAALILQSLVNTITLSNTQQSVADVSGNGSVSALDASQILQYNVGLINYFNAEAYYRMHVNNNTTLELSHQSGNKGDLIAIPFSLNQVDQLYGMLAKISFDTTYLSFDRIEFNDNGMNHASNAPVNGSILFALAGANPLTSNGAAGIIYIRIKDDAPEGLDIPITINACNINDIDRTAACVQGMISTNRSIATNVTDAETVSIYPIPAHDQMNIKINVVDNDRAFNYTITDMNGKQLIVRSISLPTNIGSFAEIKVNVAGLPSGVYQLQYTYGGKVSSKKFVIAK